MAYNGEQPYNPEDSLGDADLLVDVSLPVDAVISPQKSGGLSPSVSSSGTPSSGDTSPVITSGTEVNDKSKGDEKPSKLVDEESAKEEEKEEDPSREIKFAAPVELFYEDENKAWKPRGKGQFQTLFDKENKNYEVEMKRVKDNTLCAKHPITKAIQLVPIRGSDRSYAWSAMDSSDKEGSPVSMVFAVRFKNRETADNFQEEFQKAQTPEVEASAAGKGKHKKEKKKKESKKDKDKKGPTLKFKRPVVMKMHAYLPFLPL